MLRSMFAGVTGLRSHQTMMEVVGNNIANVNTTGFKASRVAFQDTLSQLVKGGSAGGGPGTDTGGMNAQQIGLGVRVGAIDNVSTQGSLQATGRTTDLALQGDGYFIVKNAEQTLYTRAGNFNFDNEGNLVDTAGYVVQGFLADENGRINTTGPAQSLRLPLGQSVPPVATKNVTLGGNLSSTTPSTQAVLSTTQVFDTLGQPHTITFKYERVPFDAGDPADPADDVAEHWRFSATVTGPDGKPGTIVPQSTLDRVGAQTLPGPDGRLTDDTTTAGVDESADNVAVPAHFQLHFDSKGNRITAAVDGRPVNEKFTFRLTGANGEQQDIEVDLGAPDSPTAIHAYGGPTSAEAYGQDGAPTGYLRSFSVGDDGIFTGIYSNGLQKALGQIAVASFSNPGSSNAGGLVKMGNNHLRADSNTGTPAVGVPGQLGNGSLAAGMLEMSNVDLAQEFTNLIIAQRGFQANSRVISTGDELLQDVVNIKR